jgi:FKBP-type peptidyl-prolyl cis-trans isomerase SlyD
MQYLLIRNNKLMETVENKYITLAYKLYTIENGEKEFTEEAPAEHPFQFISGLGLTLESFENQVKDLNKGDKFDFTIKAEEAYGEYDEEHVIDLPKNIFEIEGKFDSERVVEGAVIPLMTSEGQRINGSVVEVKDDVVVMDMNHPLAGCDLNFVGEITENRPATNDELLEMARMMSGGGCSGGCGGGCNCGDCSSECCS